MMASWARLPALDAYAREQALEHDSDGGWPQYLDAEGYEYDYTSEEVAPEVLYLGLTWSYDGPVSEL